MILGSTIIADNSRSILRMCLYWIILSFVTLGCSSENYSVTEISTSSGLYYEQIGDVLLSNEKWELTTSINFIDYIAFSKYSQMQAQKFEDICQRAESFLCETGLKTIQEDLNAIEATDQSMMDFLGIKSEHKRVKRFWIEALGVIPVIPEVVRGFKALFDGGDDNQPDLSKYDRAIEKLYSGQRYIENKLDEQKTIFLIDAEIKNLQILWLMDSQQETLREIDSITRDFEKSAAEKAKQIEELKNKLDDTNNKLREREEKQKNLESNVEEIKNSILRINERIDDMNDPILLNSLFIDFGFLLNRFRAEQDKLYDVIKKANKGELDPYVLTPFNLIEMLQQIQGQLRDGQQFPFHPSVENAHKLYNIIKIKVYSYNGKIMFMMNIPLVRNKRFGIHKMTSMPAAFAPNRFLFILPQEPFLIVDSEYHEYLLMSHSNFKEYCQDIEDDLYLCNQVDHLSRSGRDDNCEMELFSTALEIPRSCDIRMMEIKQTMFLQLQKSGSWIYAAKADDSIMITCNGSRRNIALRGSGFLSLPERCEGRTEALRLESLLKFTKPVKSNYSAQLDLTDLIDSSTIDDDLEIKTNQLMKTVILPFDVNTLMTGSIKLGSVGNLTWLYIMLPVMALTIIATIAFLVYKKKIDMVRIRRILFNRGELEPRGFNDTDDRLVVKAKLNTNNEKVTRISIQENPSLNDPESDYLTVRFKVQKQTEDKLNNSLKPTANVESKESDELLGELKKKLNKL